MSLAVITIVDITNGLLLTSHGQIIKFRKQNQNKVSYSSLLYVSIEEYQNYLLKY